MNELIKEHIEKFGIDPNIIGIYWNDPDQLEENIKEAIRSGIPYDEENELDAEELKAYKEDRLKF